MILMLSGLGFLALVLIIGRQAMPDMTRERGDLKGINALRGLAALAVLGAHVTVSTPSGNLAVAYLAERGSEGVALFFVLSGFLLWRPFDAALSGGRPANVSRYFVHRVLRIVPLYVFVTVVVFVASRPLVSGPLGQLLTSLTFTGNYTGGHHVLDVAWSLDDEVAYYLMLPILYLAATMIAPRRARALLVAIAVGGCAIASNLWWQGQLPGNIIHAGPLEKFELFAIGMLLAVRLGSKATRPRAATLVGLGVTSAALVAAGLWQFGSYGAFVDPLLGIGFALAVAIVALDRGESRALKVLSSRPLVLIGELSFGIYLWHEPIHHVLFNSHLMSSHFWLAFLQVATWTVAVSAATYLVVERPALRLGRTRIKFDVPATTVFAPA